MPEGRVPSARSVPISRERLPLAYSDAWRARFARRFAWSARFRRLILNPSLGALGARLAGQRLARLALATLPLATAPSLPPA